MKENNVIKSFNLKKTLNPKIWENSSNPKTAKLRPEIRERLIQIGNEFLEFVDLDLVISDMILMGSLANYNWSEYSDFDLHILVDMAQFPKEQKELYLELFDLKKTIFNYKHDIKIKGYDVELYLQDDSEIGFSEGIYSLTFDEFKSIPNKTHSNINKNLIVQKSQQWMEIIDGAIESAKQNEDLEESQEILKKYYKKIKKYRQCGLEEGGEFSIENMVFKFLRRNGYIEKLLEFRNKNLDSKLSMTEYKTNF